MNVPKVLPRKKDVSEMSDMECYNAKICPKCRQKMSMYMHEKDEYDRLVPYCVRCDAYWTILSNFVCENKDAHKIRSKQFQDILTRQRWEAEQQKKAAKARQAGRVTPMGRRIWSFEDQIYITTPEGGIMQWIK